MPSGHSRVRHPASLLSIKSHNPYLVHLMGKQISIDMIQYVARHAASVIQIEDEAPVTAIPTPPHTPHRVTFLDQKVPPAHQMISLENFILCLVKSSNVQVATLLTTLIYMDRVRAKLSASAKGQSATLHVALNHIFSSYYRNAVHASSRFPGYSYRHRQVPERLFSEKLPLGEPCRHVQYRRDQPYGETAAISS